MLELMKRSTINMDYARSVIFGFEDALVSTTGVVVGISVGTSQQEMIVLAGLVTIAVEALSMAAGQYLSERTVHEMDINHTHKDSLYVGAGLMFLAYALGGLIPLLPILLFPFKYATTASVIFAFLGLFTLGYVKGLIVGVPRFRSAFEVLIVGGLATIIGLIVGLVLKI